MDTTQNQPLQDGLNFLTPVVSVMQPLNQQDIVEGVRNLRHQLADNDFLPVPVATGDKKPFVKGWQKLAAKRIFKDTAIEFSSLNTGILCNGLRAVDIDIDDVELAGYVRNCILKRLGDAPTRWRGNSGKCLLLYRAAEGEPTKVRLFNRKKGAEESNYNIEVLGQGQQFVAFGSHPTGVEYQWDYSPVTFHREQLTAVSEAKIAETLEHLRPYIWTESLLNKCCDELASTAKGEGRDDSQNKQAFTMGGYVATGFITKERVVEKLYAASVTAGRLQFNTEADLRAHLERSVDEGTAGPLQPPTTEQTAHEIINRVVGELGDAGGQSRFATAAVARVNGDMRYDPKAEVWYVWTGKVWQRNAKHLVTQLVKNLCDEVSIALIAEDKKNDAASVVSMGFIGAIVQHMELMDEVWIESEQFDSNKTLLNTPDFAIELNGYIKRKHDREDYCTKMTAVSPADGEPVQWNTFKSIAWPIDVTAMMMRWAAYSLSGLTHIRKFVFLYGPTGTGKSVYRETLLGILGDYGAAINVDTITEVYGTKNTADIARTKGCRAVFCPEVDERKLDEKTLKAFTGEDTMAVRLLYQNYQDYKGEAKLTFSGNHEPQLRNVDDSMRTRFVKVPCMNKPTREQYVDQLQEKLQAEWSMILHQFIVAYQDLSTNGLQIPASVERATDEYFESQDLLKEALDVVFEFDHAAWTSLSAIQSSLSAYGKEHGIRELINIKSAILAKRFVEDFKLTKHKKNTGQGFFGIKLRGFQSGWADNKVFDASTVSPATWPPVQ